MLGGIDAIEDDCNVRKEFRDNVERALRSVVSNWTSKRRIEAKEVCQDLPHTVQRMNSIVASLSRTKFKLMAIADCPIMIVPMW